MSRLLVMAILVGAMLALDLLNPGALGEGNPKTLAAIGFIVLAAFTLGDLVARLGLPRITGFILTGVVFGPSVADLFTLGIVQDLGVFNDLAVGLIALSAGLELELPRVRAVLKPALRILALKIPFVVLAGGGTVLLLAPFLPGLGEGMDVQVQVLAMVFGVVLLGTSPAVTLAIISETSAKGRLADLSLALAVLKDVIMVVGLAVALAVGKSLLAGGSFESDVFGHLAIELLLSLGVGALVGLSVIAYTRFFKAEMMLFIVAVVLGMNEVAHQFHLEALLVFITAGFVVRNFSRFGDSVLHPLEKVALPVFVVFFTTAGAGLDLSAVADYGPIALAIAVVRAVALYFSARWGASWAGETPAVRDNAWLAFLPQAGVAIGLLLVASNQLRDFPEMADPLNFLGISLVAINLLVGPVTLKLALARAGELPAAEPDAATSAAASPTQPHDAPDATLPAEGDDEGDDDSDPSAADPLASARPPEDLILRREWLKTRTELERMLSRIRDEAIAGRLDPIRAATLTMAGHARLRLQSAAERCGRLEDPTALRRALTEGRAELVTSLLRDIEGLRPPAQLAAERLAIRVAWAEAELITQAASTEIVVPESPEQLTAQSSDTLWIRVGKLVRRTGRALNPWRPKRPTRTVPWRRLVRRTVGGDLIVALDPMADLRGRSGFKAIRRMERLLRSAGAAFEEADDRLDAGATGAQLQALLDGHVQDLRDASQVAVADLDRIADEPIRHVGFEARRALDRLSQLSELAGTFALPERHYRYSQVAPLARDAVARAEAAMVPWSERQQALLDRLQLWLSGDLLMSRLRTAVTDIAGRPAQRLHGRLGELLDQAVTCMEQARPSLLAAAAAADLGSGGMLEETDRVIEELERRVERPLAGIVEAIRSGPVVDRLLAAITEVTNSLPERVALLADADVLALESGQPPTGGPMEVHIKVAARQYLDREVAVRFTNQMRGLDSAASEAAQVALDVRHMLAYHLGQAADHVGEEGDEGDTDAGDDRVALLVNEALDWAEHQLARQVEHVVLVGQALTAEVAAIETNALAALWRQLHGDAESARDPTDTLVRRARERVTALYRARLAPPIKRGRSWLRARLTATRKAARAREEGLVVGARRIRERMAALHPDAAELPYIYGKLFSLAPVENVAFVAGRDEELQTLRAALEGDGGGAVALVGARGSGRTSLLRVASAAAAAAENRALVWLDPDTPTASEAELMRWLSKPIGGRARRKVERLADDLRERRPIVVLDGLEHLFHRSAGGLEAIEALLGLIVVTRDTVQWIVSAEHSIWRLLDEVTRVSRPFHVVLELGPLQAADLRQAVKRRHRLSGLDLEFGARETSLVGRWVAAVLRKSPEEMYFRELADQSGGVPRTALQLWLASLTKADANRFRVHACPPLRIDALSRLDSDLVLALRIALEEGPIDVAEFAASAGWEAHVVRASLSFLEAAGLVVSRARADGEPAYEVDLVAQGPVLLELRRRGVILASGRRV